jgi:hypothetical protein
VEKVKGGVCGIPPFIGEETRKNECRKSSYNDYDIFLYGSRKKSLYGFCNQYLPVKSQKTS